MSDQDYAAYLQYHIEAKQQIKDYQNSPEYAVASFMNEQKEAKKAMRRERMLNLKQKFLEDSRLLLVRNVGLLNKHKQSQVL